jgi:hypothetical protein
MEKNSKNQRQDWQINVGILRLIWPSWGSGQIVDVDDNCKSASSNHTNQAAKHMAHVLQILQHVYQNIKLA